MNRITMATSLPRVAIYARVSSEHQAQEQTIASQVAALRERIAADGLTLDDELCFLDDGVSGATLARPALERLRDLDVTRIGASATEAILAGERAANGEAADLEKTVESVGY